MMLHVYIPIIGGEVYYTKSNLAWKRAQKKIVPILLFAQ